MNWKDITLRQYNDIVDIQKTSKNPANSLIEYFFDVHDAESSLPIGQYLARLHDLQFINSERVPNKLQGTYTLNGRNYVLQTDPSTLSAAQYVDFEAYNRTKDTAGLLSVIMIPEKAKYYNAGYDIEQVKEDMLSMCILDVDAVNAFFLRLLQRYIKILARCLSKLSKTKGVSKETARAMMDVATMAGECCRTCSPTAS